MIVKGRVINKTIIQCSYCFKELRGYEGTWKFCHYCGSELRELDEASALYNLKVLINKATLVSYRVGSVTVNLSTFRYFNNSTEFHTYRLLNSKVIFEFLNDSIIVKVEKINDNDTVELLKEFKVLDTVLSDKDDNWLDLLGEGIHDCVSIRLNLRRFD